MNEEKAPQGAVIALGATVIIWAYSWIVMKQVLRYAGPFDFAAIRYSAASALLFLVLVAMRRPLAPPPLLGTAWWACRRPPLSRVWASSPSSAAAPAMWRCL